MRKELKIQKLLREFGLEKVKEDLVLEVKEKGDLILLKYNQIAADWSKEALHECRGLILDRSKNFEVVCYPYEKFFNIGEGYCANIDWDSAKIYDKEDGSLMTAYYYNNEWHVATSGTIDASSAANNGISSFADLFWKAVKDMYGDVNKFKQQLFVGYYYMFELCTPENQVVAIHNDYTIKLHGVRNIVSFEYVDIDNMSNSRYFVKAKCHPIKTLNEMLESFENMTWQEEGYVVVDKYFKRAKLKNPKYVAMHHTHLGNSPFTIFDVIKNNESDEYLTYFPSRSEEVLKYVKQWNDIIEMLKIEYNAVKDIESDKDFALTVLNRFNKEEDKAYAGLLFSLRNNNIKTIHEGMVKIPNKFWYYRFNK